MNLRVIRHGFLLIALALATGVFVGVMPVPRLGLSAHLSGLMGGMVLILVGVVWPCFELTPLQQFVVEWGWMYANYANWLVCLIGAFTGAGRLTPLAGNGATGSPVTEGLVAFLLVTISMFAMAAGVLSVWGLRGAHRTLAPKPASAEFSRTLTSLFTERRA
jgi:hydroxylaminobenzene mutase